jgi:hypothetical protein
LIKHLAVMSATLLCLLVYPVAALASSYRSISSGPVSLGLADTITSSEEEELEASTPVNESQSLTASEEEELEAENEEQVVESESPALRGRKPRCVVPAIQGQTLHSAHRALLKANCRLGKVSISPLAHQADASSLVVVRQSRQHGAQLAHGYAVAVKLGPRVRHSSILRLFKH